MSEVAPCPDDPFAPLSTTAGAAITLALAVALAGCSSDTAEPSADESPLNDYLSAIWGEQEWDEDRAEAQQLEIEELTAACMQREGFEYVPYTGNASFTMGDEDGPEWGTREFAEQYGYGAVDSPGRTSAEDEASTDPDPNEAYVNSLSESEQQAYWETLYGPEPTDEDIAAMDDDSDASAWRPSGCNGDAALEVYEGEGSIGQMYEDPEFTDLFAAMQDMWDRLYGEDERPEELRQLEARWANCMDEAGFGDFATVQGASTSIFDELNAL